VLGDAAVDAETAQVEDQEDGDDREQRVQACAVHQLPVDERGRDQDGAVRHVDDPEDAHDQAEPQGEAGVDATQQEAVRQRLDQLLHGHDEPFPVTG